MTLYIQILLGALYFAGLFSVLILIVFGISFLIYLFTEKRYERKIEKYFEKQDE